MFCCFVHLRDFGPLVIEMIGRFDGTIQKSEHFIYSRHLLYKIESINSTYMFYLKKFRLYLDIRHY